LLINWRRWASTSGSVIAGMFNGVVRRMPFGTTWFMNSSSDGAPTALSISLTSAPACGPMWRRPKWSCGSAVGWSAV